MTQARIKNAGLMRDFKTGRYIFSAEVGPESIGSLQEVRRLMDKSADKPWIMTIERRRERRSLDANAYAWLLIGRISDVMLISKEECYLDMLRHYGQRIALKLRADVDPAGYFKYYEEAGRLGEYIEYFCFKGSSEYDSREMSVFIDGIVQEAEQLGIPTKTPDEIADMLSLMETAERRKT